MAPATLLDEPQIDYEVTELPQGFELIDGELREMPEMGFQASFVASELHGELRNYLKAKGLGVAVTAEASYQCFPHRRQQIRKPDVSVILCDPAQFVPPDPHCRQVPDLVVEVVSEHETVFDLAAKIDDYLKAGTKLVWEINALLRSVVIHYPDFTTRQITEPVELTGEDVLPGFTISLAAILPPK